MKIIIIFLMAYSVYADIVTVDQGEVISASKMNEVIDGVNNAGGIVKDGTATKCAEWRMADDTYKVTLVPIDCTTKVKIGLSQRDGAYEIGSGSNLASCQEYLDHQLYTGQGDGSYWIDPDGAGIIEESRVYCDMDGILGWTLIFSSQTVSGQLQGMASNTADIQQMSKTPSGSMLSIWTPYSSVSAMRFSCDSGKSGTLNFDIVLEGSTPYNGIKMSSHEEGILYDSIYFSGDAPGNSQYNTDSEFYISSNDWTINQWGTVNEYTNNTPFNDDVCAGVSQSTRLNTPNLATQGNGYFYIFVR